MVIVFRMISVLLLAFGAALIWGLDRSVSGVEATTIGVILINLGAVGALGSLLAAAQAASGRGVTAGRRRPVAPLAEARVRTEQPWPLRQRPPRQPPSP
jgi:hypothetical protein